jgi:hypothetical protein
MSHIPLFESAFRAHFTADRPGTNGTSGGTTLVFDSEDYDINSEYNVSTGVFTPAIAGYYFISVNLFGHTGPLVAGLTNYIARVNIVKNASTDMAIYRYITGADASENNQWGISFGTVILVSIGDTFKVTEVFLRQVINFGAPVITIEEESNFQGFRIG